MKKTLAIILVLVFTLSLLGGCFRVPKNVQDAIQDAVESAEAASSDDTGSGDDNGDDYSSESSDPGTAPSDLVPATNPSTSYNNYLTVKSAAMDRITTVSEESDELSFAVAMNMLGISMIDLALISLTMFGDDLASSEMAMGFLGMENVKITGSDNDYTITYTDSEGQTIKQTCQYDKGKDSLKSELYDADGSISMYFEYVNLGDNTYAAQYYYSNDDGGYEIMRAFFDADNIAAFGTATADGEPESIYGQGGFDEQFVVNEQTYMILKDGKLSVFDEGTTSTN
jgi:hypothetical protein